MTSKILNGTRLVCFCRKTFRALVVWMAVGVVSDGNKIGAGTAALDLDVCGPLIIELEVAAGSKMAS